MQLLVITSLVNMIILLTFEMFHSIIDHPVHGNIIIRGILSQKKDGGNEIYYWFSWRVNIPGGQQEAASCKKVCENIYCFLLKRKGKLPGLHNTVI